MLLARGTLDLRGEILAKLVYWLPLIQIGLGQLHIPGPALIPPAFALYAFLRLRRQAGSVSATAAPVETHDRPLKQA
jgi:hypothetical protein